MKRIIIVLVVFMTFMPVFGQAASDSIIISDLVKQQIKEIEQKKQSGSEITALPQQKPAEITKAVISKPSAGLSETQYILLFALIECAFIAFVAVKVYRRRAGAKIQPVRQKSDLPSPGNKRYISRAEFARMRTNVACQLTLVKTKEELARQARKMNMGTGELELALRLQEMGKAN